MARAQACWQAELGIPRPAFSDEESHQLDVKEVQRLETQARRISQQEHSATARDAMAQAQACWRPELGIPRPAFSDEESHQLDVKEVQRLETQARGYLQEGCYDMARNRMARAQTYWRAELGIPRPAFSDEESHQLDVKEVQHLETLARGYLQEGDHDTARNRMARAQAFWRAEFGIPRPAFSLEEQRQIESTPPFAQDLTSRAALHGLARILVVLEEDCAICLDTMSLGEIEAQGPCGHMFHDKCISKWLMGQSACPLCRQPC
ncbi:hypothetical protein N7471_010546 [Penicillium samsonianum]|uniref:uncharacterized protein n=1 Tax=Penicillium samsonianum TaxID=1882272 RepID=UPI002548FB64|nr:uncharacterized protein N7471_010546 [Penicillium samsonianum]KAJ6126053.1 hypothetical protein N7471_010546 [Penicillium samsonianum]